MPWASFGLYVLRSAYTLASLLIFGFALILSFQIILFLFAQLAVEALDASDDSSFTMPDLFFLSTTLSTPVFLFGFSSLMAIATTFVAEAWSGGRLIRAVIGAPAVLKEVMYFVFFLLIPALTLICSLFARVETPWEYTCYAWLASVLTAFVVFVLAIVRCEIIACFRLISIHYEDLEEGEAISYFKRILRKVRRSVLLVQTQKYSGQKDEQYLITGEDEAPKGGYTFSDKHNPTLTKKSFYTYITELGCLQFMYETVDPPMRIYSIEEVIDVLPFITTQSWSLESMFCTSNRKRKIITAKGPSALRPDQIISSSVCNILGSLIIIIAVISYLFWMKLGAEIYFLVGVLCFIGFLIPLIRPNIRILQMYADINKEDGVKIDEETSSGNAHGDDGVEAQRTGNDEAKAEQTTMFRLWESSRITQPKIWVCYTGMLLQFIFFFLFPLVTLFRIGNYPIGIVFIIISFFSFLRKYFNASAILCELGSLNAINIETNPDKGSNSIETALISKANLAEVVGHISRSNTVNRWMYFFGVFASSIFFLVFLSLVQGKSNDGPGDRPPIILVDDYAYAEEETLQYPSCNMGKGFELSVNGTTQSTMLGDYAFFSVLAYENPNVTSYILPQWFDNKIVDEHERVSKYRAEKGIENTFATFKYFTAPDLPGYSVIAIRGSETNWDWVMNFQLWSASVFAQLVKWLIPYGWMWTPILDDLVWFIGKIQSEQLEKVSYYKDTTAFVEQLNTVDRKGMTITGASLGGGLAMITGAQTHTNAVAISGPGAAYSRNAVNPQISMDDIDKYVFNFIPDRDYIARIGGRPRQHQEGHCTARNADLIGCHSMWRSMCEINYRCGSKGRPVICRCHFQHDFHYPEPEPIGTPTRTFKEACSEQEQAFLDGTGSSKRASWW